MQFALKTGGPDGRLVGKISFIDLAGSERGADTFDNNRQVLASWGTGGAPMPWMYITLSRAFEPNPGFQGVHRRVFLSIYHRTCSV